MLWLLANDANSRVISVMHATMTGRRGQSIVVSIVGRHPNNATALLIINIKIAAAPFTALFINGMDAPTRRGISCAKVEVLGQPLKPRGASL
jgi:hypothetical protein